MTADLRQLLAGLTDADVPALSVTGLSDDSRTAGAGELFIARPGPRTRGDAFIGDAVRRGVAAVLIDAGVTDRPITPVPLIPVPELSAQLGTIAERYHDHPAESLLIAGVTGTNGKTTVAHLAREALRVAGVPAAMIGTLGAHIGDEHLTTGLTTPGAIRLSALLARARDAGMRAVVMEVSSHALAQHRTAGIGFDIAVFTNLSRDHLDDHGDMDAYAGAKALLFESLSPDATAVVNIDDPASERMLAGCAAPSIACSKIIQDAGASVRIKANTLEGMTLCMTGPWGTERGPTRLLGTFNAFNAMQGMVTASLIAERLGVRFDTDIVGDALAALASPAGRLERVGDGPGPCVFVDYAHTDDALRAALMTLRGYVPEGRRLWCVFGCGGDRDPGKRPLMGHTVCALADVAVVTSDNPRTEDPDAIVRAVVAGMDGSCEKIIEVDRAAAITAAVRGAEDGDVVLIAGKGHEDYQLLPDGAGGVVRRDFDDRLVAADALNGAIA